MKKETEHKIRILIGTAFIFMWIWLIATTFQCVLALDVMNEYNVDLYITNSTYSSDVIQIEAGYFVLMVFSRYLMWFMICSFICRKSIGYTLKIMKERL